MKPIDVIVTLILVAIIGGALTYIIRAKRRGEKCIGCPYAKQCSKNKSSNNCCCDNEK
jgi:hypothetical protein